MSLSPPSWLPVQQSKNSEPVPAVLVFFFFIACPPLLEGFCIFVGGRALRDLSVAGLQLHERLLVAAESVGEFLHVFLCAGDKRGCERRERRDDRKDDGLNGC